MTRTNNILIILSEYLYTLFAISFNIILKIYKIRALIRNKYVHIHSSFDGVFKFICRDDKLIVSISYDIHNILSTLYDLICL